MKNFLFLLTLLCTFISLRAQDADPAQPEVEGDIVYHAGSTVTILCETDSLPSPGDSVAVTKYFERPFLNGTMTGWLSVADAKVTAVKEHKVTFVVFKEKSEILVNDEKVDHFKIGNHLKLSPFEAEKQDGE